MSRNAVSCDSLLIESCDFIDFPTGGQLSFAKQMMSSYGNRLALVGICTDDTPVGRWTVREFNGIRYHFFAFLKVTTSSEKTLIPFRLTTAAALFHHRKAILRLGVSNVFLQAPELLMVISRWHFKSICFMFPGVDNPMETSRYVYGSFFVSLYDLFLFKALKKIEIALACAGMDAIDELIERSKGRLDKNKVVQFPTRVDTGLFHPMDRELAKRKVGRLPDQGPVFVVCGRISIFKGWDLLVDSFQCYIKTYGDAHLVFVGDGEDRQLLEQYISKCRLTGHITVTGTVTATEVFSFLNASDAVLVGSVVEGWSIAMLEALACGIPIVTTIVSGAKEMIAQGQNGYLVESRDPVVFSEFMHKVLSLPLGRADIAREIETTYSLKTLHRDLSALWSPLA